jgi:hypothetical protein
MESKAGARESIIVPFGAERIFCVVLQCFCQIVSDGRQRVLTNATQVVDE